jgi:hypothetical protein
MTSTVQWQAHAGVTHAWLAHCEGYVSLCGREVSGFGGQLSGIRCGLCATASGWAEATGESSYLTPQEGPGMFRAMEPPREVMPPRRRRLPPPVSIGPVPERSRPVSPPDAPAVIEPTAIRPPEPVPTLQAPESLLAYRTLPEAEQRYWAPMMLARMGQDAVWDQAQETAEQFQSRCYAGLQAREDEA